MLFNSSQNKNYFDIDNLFLDGGTGSIIENKTTTNTSATRKKIDAGFSMRTSPINQFSDIPLT